MKLENERDFKHAESLILSFKKVTLNGFSGTEAYALVSNLEWLVRAMSEYKNPPAPPVIKPVEEPIKSTMNQVKNKKKESK